MSSDLVIIMDKVNFNKSTKNIPVSDNKQEYRMQFIRSVNELATACRWKAKSVLKKWKKGQEEKEKFGFKSTKLASRVEELAEFESKLYDLAKDLEFRDTSKSNFLRELAADIAKVKRDPKVIVSADKSSNYCKMEKERHKELLLRAVHDTYKKGSEVVEEEVNQEARTFAIQLDVDDRVFRTERREALISLKDHKPNFANNPEVRLINPTKPELGRISKQKLAAIVQEVKEKSGLTQWRSDTSAIKWFEQLEEKATLRFIEFDIMSFYPNITRELLNKAIQWAQTMVDIPREDVDLIMHTKLSILVSGGDTWVKRGQEDAFDVGMGSYDGAEVCELVGLFLLSELAGLPINGGLYRDDALFVSSLTPKENNRVVEKIKAIMGVHGLEIKAKCNSKVADFLDVTMDLGNNRHMPFRKPGQVIEYINIDSNHPPHVLKNTVAEVAKRLSTLSSSKQIFDAAKGPEQEALRRAGYTEELIYQPEEVANRPRRRQRKRQVMWFNPPYCMSLKTKVGQRFLNILDTCFPADNPLHRVFNRHTVQLSYRTMPSLAKIISGHNAKVVADIMPEQRPFNSNCNCRGGTEKCPVDGARCKDASVVYQADVTAVGKRKEGYVGMSGPSWKLRYNNHTDTFRHSNKRVRTRLAGYIWTLQDEGLSYNIKWQFLARANTYKASSKTCRLCLSEKYHIMHSRQDMASLNKRKEFFSSCLHKEKLLL